MLAVVGCGDNLAGPGEPGLGSGVELSLEESTFSPNQSCEVSIAAANGRVVVASIQQRHASAETFEVDTMVLARRVILHVSHDGGQAFGEPVDPLIGDGTDLGDVAADPVVRATHDGTFFVGILRTGLGDGVILRTNDGETWTRIAEPNFIDKEWIAIDEGNRELYVGAAGGYWRYDFNGTELVRYTSGRQIADAYVDETGVSFAAVGRFGTTRTPYRFIRWDGTNPPIEESALESGSANELFTEIAWSIGSLPGGRWSVRAQKGGDDGSILLRVEQHGDVTERTLTGPGAIPFLPAATTDASGHLHVVWYDSGGEKGVLRYTRSLGPAPFEQFMEPVTIDDDAVPGGFYPSIDIASGGRRVREYIGIATDDDRVHIAWTHAPNPPSRVRVLSFRVSDLKL